MNYKDYQDSRNLTWNILIQENITELPVNIVTLCKRLGVGVKYYVLSSGEDGECTIAEGIPYILVSRGCTTQRKRFTIAHELGHLLLGHVGKYTLTNHEPSHADNPVEQAANVFASRLLAPACVLWGCGVRSTEDIIELCDISQQAAEYRMERMRVLYKRNKFLTSPLERQVYSQFEKFILDHQHRANF